MPQAMVRISIRICLVAMGVCLHDCWWQRQCAPQPMGRRGQILSTHEYQFVSLARMQQIVAIRRLQANAQSTAGVAQQFPKEKSWSLSNKDPNSIRNINKTILLLNPNQYLSQNKRYPIELNCCKITLSSASHPSPHSSPIILIIRNPPLQMKARETVHVKQTSAELNDASQVDYNEFITQGEFAQLSDQINLDVHRRDRLLDSLYGENDWFKKEVKFMRKEEESPYEEEYKKWKGSAPEECSFKETYSSALNLVSKGKQQSEVKRLMGQHRIADAVYSYGNQNDKLQKIKTSYEEELARIVAVDRVKQSVISDPSGWKYNSGQLGLDTFPSRQAERKEKVANNIESHSDSRHKMVEMAVQQQLLQRIKKINETEKQEEEKMRLQQKYKKTCFVEMITHPPHQNWTKQTQNPIRPYQSAANLRKNEDMTATVRFQQPEQVTLKQKSNRQPKYNLNVDSILKIPCKQFLIFYSENYHQILSLSSPDQLRKINRYRDEALSKEEALQKLKKKVAGIGQEQIAKLSPEAREKLFRVLYEKDVAQEKYYHE